MPVSRLCPGGASCRREIGRSRSAKGCGRAPRARKSDTSHTGTFSIPVRGAPRPQNAMKPWFQRVRTRWKPGFTASGTRASSHDQLKLAGTARFRARATPYLGTYGRPALGWDHHDVTSSRLRGTRRVPDPVAGAADGTPG